MVTGALPDGHRFNINIHWADRLEVRARISPIVPHPDYIIVIKFRSICVIGSGIEWRKSLTPLQRVVDKKAFGEVGFFVACYQDAKFMILGVVGVGHDGLVRPSAVWKGSTPPFPHSGGVVPSPAEIGVGIDFDVVDLDVLWYGLHHPAHLPPSERDVLAALPLIQARLWYAESDFRI